MKRLFSLALVSVLHVHASFSDSITHGGTTVDIDFVGIGYAGNSADSTGFGTVAYAYRIGKYEITANQWASVIAADPAVGNAGLYSGMQPTANVSWLGAARFCNWLTSGSYMNGAYLFSDPDTLTGVDRDSAVSLYGTTYVLPTRDEWYKAAYFKSDGTGYTLYATGDAFPAQGPGGENYGVFYGGSPWDVGSGAVENNGTYDINGNLWEWSESPMEGFDESYLTLGAGYSSPGALMKSIYQIGGAGMNDVSSTMGFRVAAIPEPTSVSLLGLGSIATVLIRRKSHNRKAPKLPKNNQAIEFEECW